MFTEQYIRFEAGDARVFQKGKDYYLAGCVFEIDYQPLLKRFSAMVEGTYDYHVLIDITGDSKVDNYSCTCPAFFNYEGACKHIVAALFEILSRKSEWAVQKQACEVQPATRTLFSWAEQLSSAVSSREAVALTPILCVRSDAAVWLELTITSQRTYVVKDIKAFVEAYLHGTPLHFGKQLTYDTRQHTLNDVGEALMAILISQYHDEAPTRQYKVTALGAKLLKSAFSEPRQFKLTHAQLEAVIAVLKGGAFNMYVNEILREDVVVRDGRPPLDLSVRLSGRGAQVALDVPYDHYVLLDAEGRYVFYKGVIYRMNRREGAFYKYLMACFSESKKSAFEVPELLMDRFVYDVLPTVRAHARTVDYSAILALYETRPLKTSVYFDRFESGVTAKVLFDYDGKVFNPCVEAEEPVVQGGKRLFREFYEERRVTDLLTAFGFDASTQHYVLHDENALYYFLEAGVDPLKALADLYYSDDFKQIKIRTDLEFSFKAQGSGEHNWLEVTFDYSLDEAEMLLAVYDAYVQKKKYHRLKDGTVLKLDAPKTVEAMTVLEHMALSKKQLSAGAVQMPLHKGLYLMRLLERQNGVTHEMSPEVHAQLNALRQPGFTEADIVPAHRTLLRDYQKTGVLWLKTLAHLGLGGILADDMGLGKTLQVLSFLVGEKAGGNRRHPALVVAPTSLVYNWQEEARRFTPSLDVHVVVGTRKERLEKFEAAVDGDLIVTTYGMLKRDIDVYEQSAFDFCFIDEAQHIKNPKTLNARAVKRVRAKAFFALTGTPIENALTELWSIFDFILPDYLGTLKQFMARYTSDIDGGEHLGLLKHQIEPFVLRRVKEDVLTELPDKIESKMICEMTKGQSALYKAQLLAAQESVRASVEAGSFKKDRVRILSLLTRLRQTCCHPSMFLEDYKGGSGKTDQLMEIIGDAVAGGHRLLIFSQFTSYLKMIETQLAERELSYFYLDGSTPSLLRLEYCKAFNSGEGDVFLISLKAGGTGLNLTGADMVVHVDPWWNPAVEDQATDRAYRMGQTKAVQVFKLITKDTIEEKIFDMQQQKKALIDAVIESGGEQLMTMDESALLSLFDINH